MPKAHKITRITQIVQSISLISSEGAKCTRRPKLKWAACRVAGRETGRLLSRQVQIPHLVRQVLQDRFEMSNGMARALRQV